MKLDLQVILRIGFGWINLDFVKVDRERDYQVRSLIASAASAIASPRIAKFILKTRYLRSGKPASSRAPSARADQSISARPFAILEINRSRRIAAIGIGARNFAPGLERKLDILETNGKRNPAGYAACARSRFRIPDKPGTRRPSRSASRPPRRDRHRFFEHRERLRHRFHCCSNQEIPRQLQRVGCAEAPRRSQKSSGRCVQNRRDFMLRRLQGPPCKSKTTSPLLLRACRTPALRYRCFRCRRDTWPACARSWARWRSSRCGCRRARGDARCYPPQVRRPRARHHRTAS